MLVLLQFLIINTNRKLVILPSYIAKGLEFDTVIVYTDINNYYKIIKFSPNDLFLSKKKIQSLKNLISSFGGDERVRTSAPCYRPNCLANSPLHHLGTTPLY